MKKTILSTIFLLLAAFGAKAQLADGKIKIYDVVVTEQNDKVKVNFTAVIDENAVKRNHTLVFAPVMTGSNYSVSMPPIIVLGKGAKASLERREWVANRTLDYPDAVYAANGQKINYSTVIPSQLWMDGSNLQVESVIGGCCSYMRHGDIMLADNIDLRRQLPEPEPEPEWEPVTVADHLSTAFPFVVPESEFDENEPFKTYGDERDNSLVIYYYVGKYDIVPEYMDNKQTLHNLSTAINMILNSSDSKPKHIVVAGFASPEGSLKFNDRLAYQRAVSVKDYLLKTTDINNDQIRIYNGSVDWLGFRSMMVKSNLPEKDEIVDIIDNTPILDNQSPNSRLGKIMKLNGGRTYRYLLNEYFPYLRNGTFIKVYYENN